MEKSQLSKPRLRIPSLFLGTWAIGGWMWGGTEEKSSIEAIQAAIDEGIGAIDTAPAYGMGFSEELVGKAIQGRRDQVFLATKCGLRWDSKEKAAVLANQNFKEGVAVKRNLNPDGIVWECEQSLKRLKVEAIDLYQIHWPDPTIPLEESWNAMSRLKKEGKVRAIGVCNYDLEQLKVIHALHPVDSVQLPYSLIRRAIEKDIIPFCEAERIATLAYSPLETGLLSGKYQGTPHFPTGDHRSDKQTFAPKYLEQLSVALGQIRPIAEKHKATLTQVIINCTLHQPGITAVLIGARTVPQAKENAACAKLKLSQEEREFITKALSLPALQRPLYEP
jgi:aryl-alcohol dehydrogenase-like predicted oxidoreductase